MNVMSHMWYWLVIVLLLVWGVKNSGQTIRLERHVQYLEDYIEDNGIPTPAMRKS